MEIVPPTPEKSDPLLSQQPSSKSLGSIKPPPPLFFLNLVGSSTRPQQEKNQNCLSKHLFKLIHRDTTLQGEVGDGVKNPDKYLWQSLLEQDP